MQYYHLLYRYFFNAFQEIEVTPNLVSDFFVPLDKSK